LVKDRSQRTQALPDFPKNRYEALEQAERLLRFKPLEWEYLLTILTKADGWLSFNRGGIDIEWMRHREGNKLHLSFVTTTDNIVRSAVYTFSLQELAHLKSKTQLGIEDCEAE